MHRFLAALPLLVMLCTPSFAATWWNCTAEARNGKDPTAIGKGCETSRARAEADAIGECREYGANAGKVCSVVECHADKPYCSQDPQ